MEWKLRFDKTITTKSVTTGSRYCIAKNLTAYWTDIIFRNIAFVHFNSWGSFVLRKNKQFRDSPRVKNEKSSWVMRTTPLSNINFYSFILSKRMQIQFKQILSNKSLIQMKCLFMSMCDFGLYFCWRTWFIHEKKWTEWIVWPHTRGTDTKKLHKFWCDVKMTTTKKFDLNKEKNVAVLLARRSDGVPKESDFKIEERELRPLQNDEILVRNVYLSMDPFIYKWISAAK